MVKGLPFLALALALPALLLGLRPATPFPLEERVPEARAPEAAAASAGEPANLRGRLTQGPGTPADLPGDWPGFRGALRDGVSREAARLARAWPASGPPVCWSLEVGEGYAGAAVGSGRVYLHDYLREEQKDAIRCLSLADGKEIWRYAYPLVVKRNHGMSRTVPALAEKYLVAFGPKCHVTCLEPRTGKLYWALDLVREYGAVVPPWYAGQCPLLEGERVVLAPGGKALLVAVDCASGKVLWQTPNPRGWKQTHSSIVPLESAGRRMYVYVGSGGVAGVDAASGTLLWDTVAWKIQIAAIASPVPAGDGRIFFAGGYNAGSLMLRLELEGQRFKPVPVVRLAPEVFGATQQTPILYEGFLYGVRPNGELVCLALDGKVRWTSGSTHRFGLGPFLVAAGLIYLLDDNGRLTLAEASPEAFRFLARAQVLPGHESWGPLALAGGRLLARDLTRLVCLDVAEREP